MRKFFLATVSAVAILFAGLSITEPAQATSQDTTVSQSATVAIPADASGYKFWSPDICVDGSAINGSYYRVAYLAQQWNIKSGNNVHLNYEDDCAAAGYPPSRRMVVGTFSSDTIGNCLTQTNYQTEGYHGFARWTNGPGVYINIGSGGACVQNQNYRDHIVSAAIGWLLGLKPLNSAGYNSRVMNNTTWSFNNVPLPDLNSGSTLANIYTNVYCQPSGTTC